MKAYMKFVVAGIILATFAWSLNAGGNKWGTNYVAITGIEELTSPPQVDDWSSFGTTQTLSIPWLGIDEMVVYFETNDTQSIEVDGGTFYYGTGDLYCDEYSEPIAKVSYTLITEVVGFDPLLALAYWKGEILLTGTFWDGPLAGFAITQTIHAEGAVDVTQAHYPERAHSYSAAVNGHLISRDKMTRKEWLELLVE